MKKLINAIGPAIIVAAVVLGPGSILTSSKVGATLGLAGLPVVFAAAVLMIGMVALAARLGAVYDGSIGDELAKRVGRPVLGFVTAIILLTSWRVFYGSPSPVTLASVGDVAVQLEPLFGSAARVVFCIGILAGALSSFLVNALIGGTVLSDTLGKGSKLSDRWPLHLTTVALVIGSMVAIISLAKEGSTVHLITLAQALTVLGIPGLALALIFLGTRKELTGKRKIPRLIIFLALVGLLVSCVLAFMTAGKVYQKWSKPVAIATNSIRATEASQDQFQTSFRNPPRNASRWSSGRYQRELA